MAVGNRTYQFALIILRDIGNEPNGSMITSRGTSEHERDAVVEEKARDANICQLPNGS